MTKIKQLALDVDGEITAGSPWSITFTPTDPVTFSSPAVAYRTQGGDVVTGTAVPSATTDGDTLTLSWSAACSAANNTNTGTRGLKYLFEARALVNGAGPFPIFGGDLTVWPFGVATGPSGTSSITGTINVGGVEITGTINLAGGGSSTGQIDGGSATSVYGGTTSIDGGTA